MCLTSSILLRVKHWCRYLINSFADDVDAQTEIVQLLNEYERHMPYNYILGFETFIDKLKRKGINAAVVTSSNLEKMQNVYNQHPEFKGYFDEILTSEDFDESKPSPDCYLKAAARFGVSPKDCVVLRIVSMAYVLVLPLEHV